MPGSLLEVFSSIQGEGIRVGERHLFLRFAGCNLRCRFCDTPVDEDPPDRFPVYLPNGGECRLRNPVEADVLSDALAAFPGKAHRMVSFTGGEPLLQARFVGECAAALRAKGFERFYLETNGTLAEELEAVVPVFDVVAMDIKLPSAYGGEPLWNQHARCLAVAPEKTFVKSVVVRSTPLEEFLRAVELVADVSRNIPFVIQPVWPVETPAGMLSCFQHAALEQLDDVRVIAEQQQLLGMR